LSLLKIKTKLLKFEQKKTTTEVNINLTFVNSSLFAYKVTNAAQTTNALELDKPELFGTVPKIQMFKPRN
jgi:hypothetical protein